VVESVLELNCGMGGREYLYLEAVGGDNYVSAVFGGPGEKKKGREPQIFSQFLGGNIFPRNDLCIKKFKFKLKIGFGL
jgi:hypothetical protein